jgi:hypothetical protein
MKSVSVLTLWAVSMGCAPSVSQIGKVNMISTRNVESTLDYELISTYAGGSKRELRRARAETVEQAVDDTVRRVPGGEFLANARIYFVRERYFAVEGDVWGRVGRASFRGFAVGDKVSFKTPFGVRTGVIESLRDDRTCFVREDDSDSIVEYGYDAIFKRSAEGE